MGFDNYLQLVAGLALFLFGMQMMSEKLEKAAGSKFRNMLQALTKNRFSRAYSRRIVYDDNTIIFSHYGYDSGSCKCRPHEPYTVGGGYFRCKHRHYYNPRSSLLLSLPKSPPFCFLLE